MTLLGRWTILLAAVVAAAACTQQAGPATSILITVQDVPPGEVGFRMEGTVSLAGEGFHGLDQLQAFSAIRGFDVDAEYFKEFDATFVNGINGLIGQAGPDDQWYYWEFVYNGELSELGADQVPLKEGDSTHWRFILS